jgi:hypothetical protein
MDELRQWLSADRFINVVAVASLKYQLMLCVRLDYEDSQTIYGSSALVRRCTGVKAQALVAGFWYKINRLRSGKMAFRVLAGFLKFMRTTEETQQHA